MDTLRRALLLAVVAAAAATAVRAQTTAASYPGTTWARLDRSDSGWSAQRLDEIGQYLKTVPTGSVVIVERGLVVAEWGDVSRRVKLSSTRKSLLSALYGIYVHDGRIDMTGTLEKLGVNDVPPLSPAELRATVGDVLKGRSGIYRAFVGGTPAMRAEMPLPDSHPPGTFWYYNNWDFNVAGSIFERQAGTSIGSAFAERIAKPTQMQDFRPEDVYYVSAAAGKPAEETSTHRAYQFRMSARDLARFGHLFLRNGVWQDRGVIPSAWIVESTTSYSSVSTGGGYGYFWWINDWPGVSEPHYSAKGALGKHLVVFPGKELLVVYMNHTEYPDDSTSVPASELRALPNMTRAQMVKLLQLILEAKNQ